MSMDLTGITNKNEYYTNHYFSTVFEENTRATISGWNAAARESEEIKTPWSLLRQNARQYYTAHDKFVRSSVNLQVLANIKALVGNYLKSLGYPEAKPEVVAVDDSLSVPVYLEMTKSNGAPLLWVLLSASKESDAGIMESFVFNANDVDDDAAGTLYKGVLGEIANEDLVTKILFGTAEPPRFVMLIGMNQIALIDRNKWNEKRYLQFELEEIFSRLENTTLQAMSVLLHKDSLCPDDGKVLLDELDEQSQKNASGVSQDLKYALRESIELLGNEVLYDMKARLGRDLDADPVDAGQLTLECLRYMYRMLFVLFIESRPELGYAPIKAQSYYSGYSLESLRDIADNIRDDVNEVGDGYYLHETLAKLYELIYDGYPKTEDELKKATGSDSLHDMFLIAPLKAHIFDPEYTKMITAAKLRNSCMLRIIDLMSLTRATGRKNGRRGRISYVNLGINQMGAVYEALLSYRGFIAEHDLYEVKRAGDSFNELDVGYFVSESELEQYTEDERVRYESGEKAGKLRMYEKGTFIYRLAGREREKSASYYTPEVLTKCLVKHALKELLEGKTADEILKLTICEPAMGSAAFLNEAINQLAEAYISRKEKETGEIISYEKRFNELQKVKMFIADRNVYGIDLNPVAVELAEVSLWLNTIYEGGFVPWFGTQLVNGNSLRTINELGVLTAENSDSFKRMVIGYLNLMRTNGAFEDKVFDEYTMGDGNGYMLSNDRNRWLPGRQSGRNTPRFIAEHIGNGRSSFEFDSPAANKYVDWIASCCNEVLVDDSTFRAISKFILDEAVKQNVISLVPSSVNYKIYGLNKERVFITDDVMQMRCDKCGSVYAVAAENAELWIGAPCQRTTCGGFLEEYESGEINYYGRLYSAGDLVRINAREHTGLLERPDREQLEIDFKRSKDTQEIWDPNVLSCTPTLEMGIDIGDLSTVILCSMPPAQSQFLQRAGRAGRKDGNALTLAIANARPHDLYFYSDPLDMIAGEVTPPKIFLRASAVLERQFVAFCMDSWVKKGIPDGAIPDKVGIVLKKLDARPDDMFPFNFFDDDAKAFVEIAKDAGVPAPDEDNIGYEVEGGDGEVVAAVEIAWPDRRIGFMTAEQAEDKEKLEKLGWRILNLLDAANMDVASYFGGDNQ